MEREIHAAKGGNIKGKKGNIQVEEEKKGCEERMEKTAKKNRKGRTHRCENEIEEKREQNRRK